MVLVMRQIAVYRIRAIALYHIEETLTCGSARHRAGAPSEIICRATYNIGHTHASSLFVRLGGPERRLAYWPPWQVLDQLRVGMRVLRGCRGAGLGLGGHTVLRVPRHSARCRRQCPWTHTSPHTLDGAPFFRRSITTARNWPNNRGPGRNGKRRARGIGWPIHACPWFPFRPCQRRPARPPDVTGGAPGRCARYGLHRRPARRSTSRTPA